MQPPKEYYKNIAKIVEANSTNQYTILRRETGISKPSIFTRLLSSNMIHIPIRFTSNIMHIISLNMTDLLLDLWCRKMPIWAPDNKMTWNWAVLQNEMWEEHRKSVANMTPYMT
jgi:hypothetical protein